MVKISEFVAADCLKTPVAIAAYLTEAFETDDVAYICAALDTVARAKGISGVAKATGMSRESLYKTFNGHHEAGVRHGTKGDGVVWRQPGCRADRRTERLTPKLRQ